MSGPGKIVDFPDVKRAEAEAAEWLMRLDDDEPGPEDRLAFRQWLAESELNAQAYRRLAELWGAFDQLEDLKDHMARGTERFDRARLLNRRNLFAMAASFLVVAGMGALVLRADHGVPVYEGRFVTAIGEQRTVDLPDGSVLELNTASSVDVRIDGKSRAVRLGAGEAFFEVAKDPDRPFSVLTDAGSVEAVGTAFSVRLDNGEVDVTVREGRVRLYSRPAAALEARDSGAELRPAALTDLSAGQRALFADTVRQIEPVPADLIDRKLAWRNGMLAFTGEPLSHVVAEMSRYTDVSIEIEGDALAATPVAGYFRTGKVDALLEALELMGGIEVEWIDARHVRLISSEVEQ